MYKPFERMIDDAINTSMDLMGRNVTVYHRTFSTCDCYTDIDPIYGTGGFSTDCATCNGVGKIYTDTAHVVNAIVNKFTGNRNFNDEAQMMHILGRDSEIRLTFQLGDVLVNVHSTFGATYLSSADKVQVDDRWYQPRYEKRIRTGSNYTLEVLLDEVTR